jgi:drug/metabolite transporter (DMT)-like permease
LEPLNRPRSPTAPAGAFPAGDRPSPSPARPSVSSLLLLGMLTLLWGTNWPALKIIVSVMPVATFRTLCLWTSGPALLAIAVLSGDRLRIAAGERVPLVLVSLTNITLWHLGSAAGVNLMQAGRASIIAFTMPIWAAVLSSLFLGERMTRRRLAGLGFGVAGLGALLWPDFDKIVAAPLGVLFMLLAAMSWAVGTVLIKRRAWTMSVAQLSGWQLLIGGVPVAILAALHDPPTDFAAFDVRTWLVLAYILLLPMIVAQWTWFRLLQLMTAGTAAISTLAIPVVGVLSSAALLGEPIGLSELAALVLVVLALALVLIRPAPTHAAGHRR